MTNPQKPGKPDPPGLKLRLGDDPPEKTRITNDPSAPVSPEVQNFLVALTKSKLLDDQQLTEVRKFARTVGNVAAITGDLTARQWLTPWQAQRLIAGETGFFLGKYCLLKKLGEGGMGAVYEARQGVTDRIVAVKVMAPAIIKAIIFFFMVTSD